MLILSTEAVDDNTIEIEMTYYRECEAEYNDLSMIKLGITVILKHSSKL